MVDAQQLSREEAQCPTYVGCFANTIPSSKPSAIPSVVPSEIFVIIPGAIPRSIPGTMLDVFSAKIHGTIPIANLGLIYCTMLFKMFFWRLFLELYGIFFGR